MSNPAYRIHTARLVLRCWEPGDAPQLKNAINASLQHLRPWMPWTPSEPVTVSAVLKRVRRFRGMFDLNKDYVYGVFDRDGKTVLGGSGLHPRVGEGGLEIGYWIHVDHINRGLATEVAAALTRIAFEIHLVVRVEIHCDPANVRSAAVPKKLGYVYEATLRQRLTTPDGEWRDKMVWSMLASEYNKSRARQAKIEAFDALGERLL